MRTSRFIFLVFLFSILLGGLTRAQVPELINNPQFRPDAKAAVDSIYNYNFEGAEARLSEWKKKYPEHPLWSLMEGMHYWWKVLADLESTRFDPQFVEMLKKVDYQAGKLLHNQPSHADGLIIKAIANGYLARHHANRGNWVTSMNYGRKAISAYQYLEDVKPGFADLKLAEGLKLYYVEYIPEAYPIVKTVAWALPDGDKEKGLQLLREASKEAIFASAEATYFLGNINYNYEKDYDVAVANFESLCSRYPDNSYYARILVKSYYKNHDFDRALSFIKKTLQHWEDEGLPYQDVLKEELYTWRGRIMEFQNDKERAIESYISAFEASSELDNSDKRSYYAASGFLAGRLLMENNELDKARHYLKSASRGKSDSGYEKKAKKLLSEMN